MSCIVHKISQLIRMFHQVSGCATLSSDCATALTTALHELAPACAVPITIGSMSDEPGDCLLPGIHHTNKQAMETKHNINTVLIAATQ